MTDNEIIGQAADALTEKAKFAITIPVTWRPEPKVKPRAGMFDLLLKKQTPEAAPETERELVFYPCKVANMSRIARTALLLPNEILSNEINEAVLPLIADETNLDNLVYIIAAAVQNNHLEPARELLDFIKMNMDHDDMFLCLHKSFGVLGMQSFLNSIVLARGTVSVLKPATSPADGSE